MTQPASRFKVRHSSFFFGLVAVSVRHLHLPSQGLPSSEPGLTSL